MLYILNIKEVSNSMPDKTLIVIKSNIHCMKLNTSGLLFIVIDKENDWIIEVDAIFISGDFLKNAKINIPPVDFFEAITVAREQYMIIKEFSDSVKSYILHKIDQMNIRALINNINNNQIAAINDIQRIVKSALNIDIVDVYSEFDTITNGQYNEIVVKQKIESLTLAKQVELVAGYYGNDKKITEESIKKNRQDIGIAVVYITSKQFSGICFCFVNCITKKMLYCYSWIDENNRIQKELNAKDTLYNLFQKVAEATQMINKLTPVQHEIQSKLWGIDIDLLINAIQHEASGIAGQLFHDVLQQYPEIKARAELHTIDAIRFHMLFNPPQFDNNQEEQFGDIKTDKKMVAVDLVLSPTSGKKVSQLQRGDYIYVLIDTSTPYGYDVAKALNLILDNKNTPIEAEVYSVIYNSKKGFNIFVKISDSLYGKALEEHDLKVKTKLVVDDESKKEVSSRTSLVIGIIAGIVVIAVIAFLILS